jgi:hypothetical protein
MIAELADGSKQYTRKKTTRADRLQTGAESIGPELSFIKLTFYELPDQDLQYFPRLFPRQENMILKV